MRAALATIALVACGGDAGPEDALGLVETNFVDTGFGRIRVTSDGSRIYGIDPANPPHLAAYDIDGPGAIDLATVDFLPLENFELIDDVLYQLDPYPMVQYQLSPDGTITEIGTSGVQATFLSITDEHVFHTFNGVVSMFDRETYLSRDTTDDDRISTFSLPVGNSTATSVVERDGHVWIGTSSHGVHAYDLTDPEAPELLGVIGDWLGGALALDGDLLAVQTGYDTQIVDVSDPRDPHHVAFIPGGGSVMAVRDGLLYGADRDGFQVIDLHAAGGPERISRIDADPDAEAECNGIEVTDQAVFVTCRGILHRFEPTR